MLKFCETKQIGISNPNPGFIYSLNNEHMGVFLVITFQTWLFYFFVELFFVWAATVTKKTTWRFFNANMMYGRQYWDNSIWLAKKYWKILRVVLVITSENIGFITSGRRPLVITPIFSQVMTITTSNIFQYFWTAMHYLHS